MDSFTVTPSQFERLEKQLIDSHKVILSTTAGKPNEGTITTTDGRVSASFEYFPVTNNLLVLLTKHEGYFSFIAEAALKRKLNDAIKAL